MPELFARETTLAYTDDGAGPPVVLVHGSASSRGQWHSLALRLVPSHRVLAPDLHGYGGTPLPESLASLSIDDEVALVDALIDLAGEEVHLVGHSYGGALCLRAASLRPERVRSLSLIEPTAFHLLRLFGERAAWEEIERLATRHIVLAAAGELRACAELFLGYWAGPELWREAPAELRERLVQTMPKIAQEWRMVFDVADPYDHLAASGLPVLLVRGAETTHAARCVVELLRDRFPAHAFAEIEGAGHLAPLTHPEPVNAAIAAFLERNSPP
jgi:pimeloyl-ACP methyl ester carboxylesterase